MTPRERTRQLIETVAVKHGAAYREVMSRDRSKRIAQARFAAYAALREQGRSTLAIGRIMGRDHSTVLHGLRRAPELQGVLL